MPDAVPHTPRAAAPVVLAIETSTEMGSVALVQGDRVIAAAYHAGGPELSGWVLPAIERLHREHGLTQPDAVACGIGPGAFTGVRTACATAQALAWGWSVPLHAVGSLEAFLVTRLVLAERDGVAPPNGRWGVLMDARQGETYAAVWGVSDEPPGAVGSQGRAGGNGHCSLSPGERGGVRGNLLRSGVLRPIVSPTLVSDAALASWLAGQEVAHVLGSACQKPGARGLPLGATIDLDDLLRQAAVGVARLAETTESRVDPLALQPLYVRDRVALTEAERAAHRLGLAAPSSAAGVS